MTVGDATWDKYIGYPIGILAIVGAMFASSLTGLILRYIESSDYWQIIFYRSIGFFAVFFVYVTIRRRGALTDPVSRLGGAGWSVAACMAGTFVFFVLAFQHTTVATVVILFSVSPIVVAVLARVWLPARIVAGRWGPGGSAARVVTSMIEPRPRCC